MAQVAKEILPLVAVLGATALFFALHSYMVVM
ncbi:hypothetical protein ROA7450_02166 [Roseovarius albus]|uniref:Uncharacterized protein n=1 Tax=Roseovarius albus TaxID=1247867 RepID=A0A1X6Z9B0_9RHOB|nr:hypothetical protein ROA7450_02166 [Roseovarius albus]